MLIYYLILGAGLVLLTGSALLAFRWAVRTGQFKHPAKIALQIFDEDEPVGLMTDRFPGQKVGMDLSRGPGLQPGNSGVGLQSRPTPGGRALPKTTQPRRTEQ